MPTQALAVKQMTMDKVDFGDLRLGGDLKQNL